MAEEMDMGDDGHSEEHQPGNPPQRQIRPLGRVRLEARRNMVRVDAGVPIPAILIGSPKGR